MEENQVVALRSVHSHHQINLCVKNLTQYDVDFIWINFSGKYVKYNKLPKYSYMNLTTYETHPWIAITSKTKDKLWINQEFVYMPNWQLYMSNLYQNLPFNRMCLDLRARLFINITLPLHSLKYGALLKVRSLLNDESDVDLLQIPKLLKQSLKSLIKERNEMP